MRKSSVLLVLVFLFLIPSFVAANGGMQKVAEGKYIVNVSSAPISPYVSEQQNLLIGFADIQGQLIEEDIGVDISLKLNGSVVREEGNLLAENGVLPFSYTYEKPGIYELFVRFRLPDEPDHTYAPEDFLIEVKEKGNAATAVLFATFFGGVVVGSLLKRITNKRINE